MRKIIFLSIAIIFSANKQSFSQIKSNDWSYWKVGELNLPDEIQKSELNNFVDIGTDTVLFGFNSNKLVFYDLINHKTLKIFDGEIGVGIKRIDRRVYWFNKVNKDISLFENDFQTLQQNVIFNSKINLNIDVKAKFKPENCEYLPELKTLYFTLFNDENKYDAYIYNFDKKKAETWEDKIIAKDETDKSKIKLYDVTYKQITPSSSEKKTKSYKLLDVSTLKKIDKVDFEETHIFRLLSDGVPIRLKYGVFYRADSTNKTIDYWSIKHETEKYKIERNVPLPLDYSNHLLSAYRKYNSSNNFSYENLQGELLAWKKQFPLNIHYSKSEKVFYYRDSLLAKFYFPLLHNDLKAIMKYSENLSNEQFQTQISNEMLGIEASKSKLTTQVLQKAENSELQNVSKKTLASAFFMKDDSNIVSIHNSLILITNRGNAATDVFKNPLPEFKNAIKVGDDSIALIGENKILFVSLTNYSISGIEFNLPEKRDLLSIMCSNDGKRILLIDRSSDLFLLYDNKLNLKYSGITPAGTEFGWLNPSQNNIYFSSANFYNPAKMVTDKVKVFNNLKKYYSINRFDVNTNSFNRVNLSNDKPVWSHASNYVYGDYGYPGSTSKIEILLDENLNMIKKYSYFEESFKLVAGGFLFNSTTIYDITKMTGRTLNEAKLLMNISDVSNSGDLFLSTHSNLTIIKIVDNKFHVLESFSFKGDKLSSAEVKEYSSISYEQDAKNSEAAYNAKKSKEKDEREKYEAEQMELEAAKNIAQEFQCTSCFGQPINKNGKCAYRKCKNGYVYEESSRGGYNSSTKGWQITTTKSSSHCGYCGGTGYFVCMTCDGTGIDPKKYDEYIKKFGK